MGKLANSTSGGSLDPAKAAFLKDVISGLMVAINEASQKYAKFAAENAKKTTIRHPGERVGKAVGVASTTTR